jgi:hypothetical protein
MVIDVDHDDTPKSSNPCFEWTCDGWTPVRKSRIHEDCPMTNGQPGKCSDEGVCTQCIVGTDCPMWGQRCDKGDCITCGDDAPNGDEICDGVCGACKGEPCQENADCASGYCVYTNSNPARVYCDVPCDGVCQQCSISGQCGVVPLGQQDGDTCYYPDVACAGTQCKFKKGHGCENNVDCVSNLCDPITKTCK